MKESVNSKPKGELVMKNGELNPNQDTKKSLRKFLEQQGYTPKEIENIVFHELLFTLTTLRFTQKVDTSF